MAKREIVLEHRNKIHELKQKLKASDYKALKFAEGEITTAEYAPIREERRALRAEINAIETKIASIKGK